MTSVGFELTKVLGRKGTKRVVPLHLRGYVTLNARDRITENIAQTVSFARAQPALHPPSKNLSYRS